MFTESTSSRPRPGQLNTASTTMEPPSRKPNCRPIMVTTGISALSRQCFTKTTRSRRPLARGERTQYSWNTSTNEEGGKRDNTEAARKSGVRGKSEGESVEPGGEKQSKK